MRTQCVVGVLQVEKVRRLASALLLQHGNLPPPEEKIGSGRSTAQNCAQHVPAWRVGVKRQYVHLSRLMRADATLKHKIQHHT